MVALPTLTVEGLRTPEFLRKSYFVSKFTLTGTAAGEPPGARTALESLRVPFTTASPPCETMVASRSSKPPRPAEGSTTPEAARFIDEIVSLASIGVSAASVASSGPAVPSSLNLPPPGKSVLTWSGNFELLEISDVFTSTWSYVLRFCELVVPMVMRPSLRSSLAMEMAAPGLAFPPDGFVAAPANDE